MSELPNGWCEAAVSDVTGPFVVADPTKTPTKLFKYVDIGSIDNKTQTIANPKVIKGAEAPSRARRVIHTGDTLFSTVRTYLKNIALVPEDLSGQLTSTGIAVLRPNEAINPRYLFTWACSDRFVEAISVTQDGTMYPAVSDRDVADGMIRVPPLREQGRIVTKIDRLARKSKRASEHLDHMLRLVEKYKQAILTAAIRGELTPHEDNSEFRARPFSQVVASTFYGPRIGKDAYVGSGIPTLRTTDIGDWGLITPRQPPQVRVSAAEFEKWGLKHGDLMVTRTGATIGKCAVYDETLGPALPSAYLIRVRLELGFIDPTFAVLFLLSPLGQQQLLDGRTAVAQPNINAPAIVSLKLPVPNLELQKQIVRRVQSAFSWIDRLATEATNARELIDHLNQAILAKAFRGELVPQDPNDEPASVLLERINSSAKCPTIKKKSKTAPRESAQGPNPTKTAISLS
jgi:type I restriction enzyme S subunit